MKNMTTILVVDDSRADLEFTGRLLKPYIDWKIDFADDGQRAFEYVKASPPDVIIAGMLTSDIRGSSMNGIEFVQAVRKENPQIPIILVASPGAENLAMQALQVGAASYSAKARLENDLPGVIRRVLAVCRREPAAGRLHDCLMENELAFEIENDSILVPPLIAYLQDHLIQYALPDDADRLRVGVALEEALVNAVYHGNLEISSRLKEEDDARYYELAKQRKDEHPYCDRRVFVEARCRGDEVSISIRDEGKGYDPHSLPDPTDPANLERPSGRGLLLIRTFMTAVRHNEVGNHITMVKRAGVENEN